MIIQFIVCFFATLSFAVLFSAPKRQLLFCGMTGAAGWMVYLLILNANGSLAVANLAASFSLTLMARIFAAVERHPVTVYLLAGIFPLVPGAGIYYTSYYFIMHQMEQFAAKFPKMAGNSRSIHTYEDNEFDTSYETYLRGEVGTYGEETFVLYGRFVISLLQAGKNLAYEIMSNTAKFYGYESVEDAEKRI